MVTQAFESVGPKRQTLLRLLFYHDLTLLLIQDYIPCLKVVFFYEAQVSPSKLQAN